MAKHDLTSPLLPNAANPSRIADSIQELPATTIIDPLRNHTPTIEGVHEWFKIVICVPITISDCVVWVVFVGWVIVGVCYP
ncbi:Acyltransferase [Sarracenia purpurea var. burkii]